MKIALDQAKKAFAKGEVPIGAVIIQEKNCTKKIISKAFNKRESSQNALDHAEIIAIKKACKKLKSWRLDDCMMYVTLQPCIMCAGATLNARIKKVVIGAKSDRQNELDIYQNNNLNHKTEIEFEQGSVTEECSEILKKFFSEKR